MAATWNPSDIYFTQLALELARRQVGKTGLNPAVGCVIVKDGVVLGQGATANGGRPHGEAMALEDAAGKSCAGATVYVTLEPCAHVSEKGPDCTGILIASGIKRIVCCLEDPDPRTAGQGFARLLETGVEVEVGLLASEAEAVIYQFRARLQT